MPVFFTSQAEEYASISLFNMTPESRKAGDKSREISERRLTYGTLGMTYDEWVLDAGRSLVL